MSPDFVTVFISWLNLDIGFDVCFFVENERLEIYPYHVYKALIQLSFPAYVIFLVVIVIVASECSSKFAKIIGKGNPVAVLATLVLLSYAKFFNVIITSASLMYQQPAYGSHNLDLTRLIKTTYVLTELEQTENTEFTALVYFFIVVSIIIFLLCFIYTALVFSWQWLL